MRFTLDYIDAHIHIADCKNWKVLPNVLVCSSSHSLEEFLIVEEKIKQNPQRIVVSFGIHPQNPNIEFFPLLEKLVCEGKISAIGETGFDLFTPELVSLWEQQVEVWQLQLELAEKHQLPLVIHCRKAMDKIFLYSKDLTKIPAVVFHAYPGSYQEAVNLIKRGINCFFSFGKELLRGRKNSIVCVKSLPIERLLTETDAPYQTLRNQSETSAEEIKTVYGEFALIRGVSQEELKEPLMRNFQQIFSARG